MNFLFIVFIYVVINSVTCCPNPQKKEFDCPDDSPVFNRPPIYSDAQNLYPLDREEYNTTKWCISNILFINGSYDRQSACFKNNISRYAAPLNQLEMDFILQKTKEFMLEKGVTLQNWTIGTDGHMKHDCIPPHSCPPDETYHNTVTPIDPTYMTTHWMPGQPDPGKYNGTLDKLRLCLGFNQDGLFRNRFCDTNDSHVLGADGKPEYTFNGMFCVFPATKNY